MIQYYCTTGELRSTVGCTMYIPSTWYWCEFKPRSKTMETWPSLAEHHMHKVGLLLFLPHLPPFHFHWCNNGVEWGFHWNETPCADIICRLLGRCQGNGAIYLAVQNTRRDKNDCMANLALISEKLWESLSQWRTHRFDSIMGAALRWRSPILLLNGNKIGACLSVFWQMQRKFDWCTMQNFWKTSNFQRAHAEQ